jgi:HK97 family phage major capsid protein
MEKLLRLKQARAAALAKADAADKAGKQEDFDAAMADVDRLAGEITAAQADADAEATAAAAAQRTERVAAARRSTGPRTTGNASASDAPARAVIANVRERAAEDTARGFRNPRDFALAVLRHGQGQQMDERLAPLATAGADEQNGMASPYGGFLIPEAFSPNLMQVAAEQDPTVGRTMAIPMAGPSVKINARTDKNHTTSVTGGLTFSRRTETDAGSSSRMQFEQINLIANPLMGLSYATEELLADSPISFAALLEAGFRDELGAKLLNEKLRGTGAGEYRGILNEPATVSIAKETAQTAATIVLDNVLKMRARCWGYQSAIWIANHDTYPQLAKIALPVGVGGAPMYTQSIVEDRPDLLLGRPIFYSEFAETLGTVGDLILGNWSQYLEGTLQSAQMAESIHLRFDRNERAFRVTVRNDGACWWRSAITPKKGANSLSPFVTLATR